MKKRSIFIVAGGSGGHIIPALVHAQNILRTDKAEHILFFSTTASLDSTIITHHASTYNHILLPISNRPKKIWQYPLFFFKFIRAFCISLYYLVMYKPTRVVSMGGLVSLPLCYAAYLVQIPFDLYELNAVPGRAVMHLAPWATTIFTCFEQTHNLLQQKKCRLTRYPLRFDVSKIRRAKNISAKKKIPTLLVLGGSQGSATLNKLVVSWLTQNPALFSCIRIIHQAGRGNSDALKIFYHQHAIAAQVFDYHPHLDHWYRQADVILSRAGAGTLFETVFFNKKSIIIPLETNTTTHQKDNASAIVSQYPHLFTTVTQREIVDNPHTFYTLLTQAITTSRTP